MATRRRIGVSAATTEAARRQLMQPVPCWEKVWSTPSVVTSGSSTLKVYNWVKTDKVQHFSDDEGEADEPLAPLPDEPEAVDGEEEEQEEKEENKVESVQPKEAENPDMDANQDDLPSKAPTPKPQLMMQSSEDEVQDNGGLDASIKPMGDEGGDSGDKGDQMEGLELDISTLGPDGLQLEGAHDLSQLNETDVLIGGVMMDESIDPFNPTTT